MFSRRAKSINVIDGSEFLCDPKSLAGSGDACAERKSSAQ
jgi:hypothetical protein